MGPASPLAHVPAFWLLGPVWLALGFFRCLVMPPLAALGASLAVSTAVLLIVQSRWSADEVRLALVALILATAGGWWCLMRLVDVPSLPERVSMTALTVGRGRRDIVVQGLGQKWLVRTPIDFETVEGRRLLVEGQVRSIGAGPEDLDGRLYWAARGVTARIDGATLCDVGLAPFSMAGLRQNLRSRCAALPPRMAGLVGALILGDREPSLSQEFRGWGLLHLLAVSGWHVGIVTGLCLWGLGSGLLGLGAASVITWLYVILAGCPLSAVRAAVMAQVFLVGLLVGRRGAVLNGTALAMVALLLWRPASFANLGWLLSGLATLTLASLVALKTPDWRMWLLTAPAIWLLTAPWAAPLAGGLSWSNLPLNLMAPIFGIAMGLCLILALPTLAGLGGATFAHLGEGLLALWATIADWWTDLIPQGLTAGAVPVWAAVAGLAFLVGWAIRLPLWRRCAVATLLASLMTFLESYLA